jgi:hypothetical protein
MTVGPPQQDDEDMPLVALDYSFIKLESSEEVKPVLIAVFTKYFYGMASQLVAKGRKDERRATLVFKFLPECGLHGK